MYCNVYCKLEIQTIVSKASSFDLLFSPTSCLKAKPKRTESGICMCILILLNQLKIPLNVGYTVIIMLSTVCLDR